MSVRPNDRPAAPARLLRGLRITATLLLGSMAFAAAAQTPAFPTKGVRIVIPFSPGGSADAQARIMAQKLSEMWGQQVLVEAKPGAGTTIGAAYAAASPPDGHTLYLAGASLLISGSLYKNLPYDPVKSFTPISLIANSPYFLVVHPSVKAGSVKELIEAAKAKPGGLSYASAGNGSGSHLAGELFRMLTGTDLQHVPYKGQAPAFIAMVAGEVQILFADVGVVPFVQSGKLRALAETTGKRSSLLPNVPTIGESGLPAYEMSNWGAILAPAGTPRPIVNVVHAAILKVLADPEVKSRFNSQGFETIGTPPETLAELLVSEYDKYAKVVKASAMKID